MLESFFWWTLNLIWKNILHGILVTFTGFPRAVEMQPSLAYPPCLVTLLVRNTGTHLVLYTALTGSTISWTNLLQLVLLHSQLWPGATNQISPGSRSVSGCGCIVMPHIDHDCTCILGLFTVRYPEMMLKPELKKLYFDWLSRDSEPSQKIQV